MADDLEKFLKQLRSNDPALEAVDLFGYELGDDGCEKCAFVLKDNTSCVSISLWSNSIGQRGAEALAQVLQNNKTLREIDLNSNELGPEGCEAISMALTENKTLTAIHMDGNNIGDNGAISWGLVLEGNSTLRQLDLVDNNITEEGGEAILMALEKNTSLTKLNVAQNKIGEKLLREIEGRVAQNRDRAGGDSVMTAVPVPRAIFAEKPPTPPPAAAAAAVNLEDYVPIEDFDRLFDDYEKLKAKCRELERGASAPKECDKCAKLEEQITELKFAVEEEQAKVKMLEEMMMGGGE